MNFSWKNNNNIYNNNHNFILSKFNNSNKKINNKLNTYTIKCANIQGYNDLSYVWFNEVSNNGLEFITAGIDLYSNDLSSNLLMSINNDKTLIGYNTNFNSTILSGGKNQHLMLYNRNTSENLNNTSHYLNSLTIDNLGHVHIKKTT